MDTPMIREPSPSKASYTRLEWVQASLFWSWNLIFLTFMALGFAPIVLRETFTAVRTGTIPFSYLVYALVLTLIPLACVLLGLTFLRRSPARLFALGYVIEGPLMLMLAVRFFVIRQATAGVVLPMLIALLGMLAFLWYLLDPLSGHRRLTFEALRLAGLTLMLVTGLYAAAWLAFYAPPIGAEILRWLGNTFTNLPNVLLNLSWSLRDILLHNPLMLPFSVLGVALLFYTATLFLIVPIALPVLSLRAWWRSFSGQAQGLGWIRPSLLSCLIAVASVGLAVLANRQPQRQAFALLAQPPASPAEAQSLLKRSESIRLGLLNAYLAPFRYFSAQGEVVHVSNMYESALKMPPPQAFAVQRLYEGFASPLLYQPVHSQQFATLQDNHALVEEPKEAARLYQRFFDDTIAEGERTTIVRAVRSTWSSDQAEAAWEAVDDREVRLLRQELALQEHGDYADLELHEVYQNQTADLQEVVYYFSLPESAVITGLWLGNSPDKAQAYRFQVAPRGAAQAVYREETRVMRDPALVEQIGPRQYRLRIYPVPQLSLDYDAQRKRTLVGDAPELHMWLAWREMAAQDSWSLPRLAFKRNVYWDSGISRSVNGQPLESSAEEWLPASLPVAAPIAPRAHRLDLPGGQTVLALPASTASLPALPDSFHPAVVVDRSRSMQAYASQVTVAMDSLRRFSSPEAPLDVYLTASPYRGEAPSVVSLNELDPASILYFGGQDAAELIAQFESLRGARSYDAVIVLTDGSGYELGKSAVETSVPDVPVWLVHLSGSMPLGYDDQTLQAIQASGGGVADSVEAALRRIAVSMQAASTGMASDLLDGYLWVSLPTGQVDSGTTSGVTFETLDPQDGFAALAARRLVLAEVRRNKGTIDQLDTLDYLHSLATRYGIVTPYSSMIVLVDAEQQQLLEQLSSLGDRYQREVESLGDTTPASPVPLTGVPEPHEWLLMGVAACMLLYFWYTRRRKAAFRLTP